MATGGYDPISDEIRELEKQLARMSSSRLLDDDMSNVHVSASTPMRNAGTRQKSATTNTAEERESRMRSCLRRDKDSYRPARSSTPNRHYSSSPRREPRRTSDWLDDNDNAIDSRDFGLDDWDSEWDKQRKVSFSPTVRPRSSLYDNSETRGKSVNIKPATYDGTGSWRDYRSHFEACAQINKWSEEQKGLFLAVSLRGQAQGVLGNLPGDRQQHYRILLRSLEDRFAPPHQTELYRVQLRARQQKSTETLPELGQAIRRLASLAYPTAPADLQETLAKEQFIDALIDSEMRIRIKQCRPKTLNDAVRLSLELEAYNRAEKRHERQGYTRLTTAQDDVQIPGDDDTNSLLKSLTEKLDSLQKEVAALKSPQGRTQFQGPPPGPRMTETGSNLRRNAGEMRCFKCNEIGHLKRNCPRRIVHNTTYSRSQSQGSTTQRRPTSEENRITVGAASCMKESGMFVTVSIQGIKAKCLIDTGATVTLIAKSVYEQIPPEVRPTLRKVKQKILTAGEEPLQVEGKAEFSMVFEHDDLHVEGIVAVLGIDGIIGLDFLLDNKCKVDIEGQGLETMNGKIPMEFQGTIGCYRVIVSDEVTLSPRTETIVPGKACIPKEKIDSGSEMIVETSERFLGSDRALVARAVVKCRDTVPLRIMNTSEEKQVIYPGTYVATITEAECVLEEEKEHDQGRAKQRPDLDQMLERCRNNMTTEEYKQVSSLVYEHSHVFSSSSGDFGRTDVVRHRIDTGQARPIKQPPRRLPVHQADEVDGHVKDMLEKQVIEPSCSPWASGVVLVKKKDGTTRFCVDYRRLNDVTTKDAYPLPRIDDSLDKLSGCSWFSTLDLCSGYWQVEVEPSDRPKTAFATRRGLYQFRVMPFGLCCAPATFERLMESVLAGLHWEICLIYLDDIIVLGKTFLDMVNNLREVFQRLDKAGLKLKPKKCHLFAKKVEFLGHIISDKGVETDPSKISAIEQWAVPTNVKELRSFLGMCSYYRRFIKNFASIARCLHSLTQKGKAFVWTSDCQSAYETLKNKLISSPILAHPDFSQEFILDTDASNGAIGAVLSQVLDDNERVIAYASRTLSKSEKRYCVTRKELLAVVHFVKHFRTYLYGRRFLIRTDHSSLRWLLNFKDPEGQLARWLEVLSSYDMRIEHRKGSLHGNADAMSRIPCKQCGYREDWEHEMETTEPVEAQFARQVIDERETTPTIRDMQESDPDLCVVKQWIDDGGKPQFKDIQKYGVVVKSLWSQWEHLLVKEGILYRQFLDKKFRRFLQALVPQRKRRSVLEQCHDSLTAGHLGVRKTLSKVRQGYYWPGLQADVRRYIAGCEKCVKRKNPVKRNRAPMQLVQSGFPMERIAVDILCNLPETDKSNQHILVIADYYTKWTECFAMPNMETETIAKIIVEEVVARFGMPYVIHSDQGAQFESQLFSEMCRLLGIRKTRTTPYHPQSDGMVERYNKTLVMMLSAFVNQYHTNWDELLPYVNMAYRSTEQETTGCTPNYLMLGREVSTPLDVQFELPRDVKRIPQNRWVWELQERLEEAHKFVREHVAGEMRRQKKYHDSKLSWNTFEPGDKVYVFFPTVKVGRSRKLSSLWQGPFDVIDKCSDVTYKVRCGYKGKLQVIHIDRMRKWQSQRLRNEESDQESEAEATEQEGVDSDTELVDEELDDNLVIMDSGSGAITRRQTRPPRWLQDYMANTKTTARKPGHRCPMCARRFETQEMLSSHLISCGLEQAEKKRFECGTCDYAAKKKSDLERHMKRNLHTGSLIGSVSDSDGNSDWCRQDPGELKSLTGFHSSGNEERPPTPVTAQLDTAVSKVVRKYRECQEEGTVTSKVRDTVVPRHVVKRSMDPTHRKRTKPMPVYTPAPRPTFETSPNSAFRIRRITVDVCTQTERPVKKIIRKKTTSYQVDGKTVVEVEEEQWSE